jgi:DNA (cytosine-5)-methyltransferase 1
MNSVELFSGAGGLAIGVSKTGFCHKAVIERDKNACETIRENQRWGVKPLAN